MGGSRGSGDGLGSSAGRPIESEELLNDQPEVALERLRRAVETMRLGLRNRMREATGGRYPSNSPGDAPYWEQKESPLTRRDPACTQWRGSNKATRP